MRVRPQSDFSLNDLGERVWRHKVSKNLFAQASYDWVDSIVVLQEIGNHRQIIEIHPLTRFDLTYWVPLTQEEYDSVVRQYKEIYNELTIK